MFGSKDKVVFTSIVAIGLSIAFCASNSFHSVVAMGNGFACASDNTYVAFYGDVDPDLYEIVFNAPTNSKTNFVPYASAPVELKNDESAALERSVVERSYSEQASVENVGEAELDVLVLGPFDESVSEPDVEATEANETVAEETAEQVEEQIEEQVEESVSETTDVPVMRPTLAAIATLAINASQEESQDVVLESNDNEEVAETIENATENASENIDADEEEGWISVDVEETTEEDVVEEDVIEENAVETVDAEIVFDENLESVADESSDESFADEAVEIDFPEFDMDEASEEEVEFADESNESFFDEADELVVDVPAAETDEAVDLDSVFEEESNASTEAEPAEIEFDANVEALENEASADEPIADEAVEGSFELVLEENADLEETVEETVAGNVTENVEENVEETEETATDSIEIEFDANNEAVEESIDAEQVADTLDAALENNVAVEETSEATVEGSTEGSFDAEQAASPFDVVLEETAAPESVAEPAEEQVEEQAEEPVVETAVEETAVEETAVEATEATAAESVAEDASELATTEDANRAFAQAEEDAAREAEERRQEEQQTDVALENEFWVVCANGAEFFCQHYQNGVWNVEPVADFYATSRAERPTVVFAHGFKTDMNNATNSANTLRSMIEGARVAMGESRAYRLVVWKWSSERSASPLRQDARMKAQYAEINGVDLARFLSGMPNGSDVTLVGFSFGARVVGSALQNLARDANVNFTNRVSLILVSAACDLGAFDAGGAYAFGAALPSYVLNIYNPFDFALHYYPAVSETRSSATGVAPVRASTFPNAQGNIYNVDTNSVLGRKHSFDDAIRTLPCNFLLDAIYLK